MRTKRINEGPNCRTIVRLPERPLADCILHVAAPLLEPLGVAPAPEEVRVALEFMVDFWNAHVMASRRWERPDPKPLAALRKRMSNQPAGSSFAQLFELLSARWRTEFGLDPRLVGAWSFEATAAGRHEFVCRTELPMGAEVDVPPPAEKRIAIGGTFLDEVTIRLSATTSQSLPFSNHRGAIGSDGVVTIHSKMPTVVVLFAEGLLRPIGGAPTEVMVAGRRLGPMVLSEVRCLDDGGRNDVAVLVFRAADAKDGG